MTTNNERLFHFVRGKICAIISAENKTLLGTGAFISSKGHVITCAHINIVSPEDVYILEVDTQKKYLVKEIVPFRDIDIAVLLTTRTPNLEFFKINTNLELLGRDIFLFGLPEKEYWHGGYGKLTTVISQGELQQNNSLLNVFGMEARSVFPGMSGGPIVDVDSRELVGIIYGFDKSLDKAIYSVDKRLIGMSVERNDDLFLPLEPFVNAIDSDLKKSLIINSKSDHFNLVKKISSLIELLGFKVELIDLDNNQQFDIVGDIDYGFMSVRLLIVCFTDTISVATDFEVSRKIKTYAREYKFDKACFVTTTSLSENLSKFAETENIRVLSEENFLSSMIDFSNYIEYAINQWEEDGSKIQERYTQLKGKILQNKQFKPISDVEESISEWIKDPNKPNLLILGKYGSGKTTLSRHITSLLAQEYKTDSENSRIPILMRLRDTKTLTIRELITDLLLNKFKIARSSFGIFTRLNSAGKLLLIFDGFDEMDQNRGFNRSYLNMKELTECFTKNSKAIITCRSEYFIENEEVESLFKSDEFSEIYNDDSLTVIYIDDFSDEQIEQYLNERLGSEEGRSVLTQINNAMGLKELAHRPLLLDMIVETLPRLINKHNLTVGVLYKEYINKKLDSDIRQGRTAMPRDEKFNIMCRVANFMNSNSKLFIYKDELFDIVSDIFPRESKRDLDTLTHDIVLNSFLTTGIRDGRLEFSHKSFYEFFLAAFFMKDIDRLLSRRELYFSNFGEKKLSYEVFQFMIDLGITESKLFALVQKTVGRKFQDVEYLGGNAISGLRFLGVNLENKDFDNTVLVEANFSNCSLENSTLRKCDLSNGNYNNCNLRNVDMSGSDLTLTNMKSIRTIEMIDYNSLRGELYVASTNRDLSTIKLTHGFKELQRKHLKGHNDYLFRISISPDYSKLATGSRDQTVRVWDLQSYKTLHIFKGHFGNIRGLKFATNEMLLSCGSDGRLVKWYLNEDYHEEMTDQDSDFHGLDVQNTLENIVTVDLQSNVRIWDFKSLSLLKSMNLKVGYLKGVSFWGENQKQILTVCEDCSLVLINSENLNYRKVSNQKGPLKCLAVNRHKNLIATGSEDGTVSIWEGDELTEKLNFKAHNEFTATIAFDDSGNILFSASSEGMVCIWDITKDEVTLIGKIKEEFLNDKFNCEGLILKDTKGLSPFRLKHLESAGAIIS